MYRRRVVNFQKPKSELPASQSVFLLAKIRPNENGIYCVANSFGLKNNSPKIDRQLFLGGCRHIYANWLQSLEIISSVKSKYA